MESNQMHLPVDIPCPTRQGNFIDKGVRAALEIALDPADRSAAGDLVAIAQSWWHDSADTYATPSLGYWHRDNAERLFPSPFGSLPAETRQRAGPAVAHLLENTRDAILPHIREMGSKGALGSGWFDAIHTPDGILLVSGSNSDEEVWDAAKRGKLPNRVRYLSCSSKSQHDRVAATSRTAAILKDYTMFLTGAPLQESDHRLVPMTG